MNKFYFLLLLLGPFVYGQSKLTLTKRQMFADFDTLTQTLTKISPHLPVKKELWNYNAIAEMTKRRKQIDTVSTDMSFYLLLQSVLNLAMDMHTSNNGQQQGWAQAQSQSYYNTRNNFKFSIGNRYINGKYYVTHPFVINGDTINIGYEITHLNDQKIDNYIATHLDSRTGFKYDLALKKFYFEGFYKNNETIFLDTLVFRFKNKNGVSKQYKISTTSFTQYLKPKSTNKGDTTRIEFWDDKNILFIRVTEMNEDYIPYFKNELAKYRDKSLRINKIIIDFRGNGGGSDTTWTSLYAELINKPISFEQKIDDLNQPNLTNDWYINRGWKAQKRVRENNKLLSHFNFYTISNDIQTLEPSESSINFSGKIYVLAEDHYSSTGSAISVANSSMTDNLITVGRKTGYFLGIGFSPVNFQLPNTKLSFRVAPTIEVTNAKTLSDLLQDKIQIEVPTSLHEYLMRFNYNGELSSKEYLSKYDPFIKRICEQ